MNENLKIEKSKIISLILRHKPEVIDLNLDKNGWADVEELLIKMNKHKPNYKMDFNLLENIVNNNNKQRFEFNDDKTKIRARQGHSINVDVELKETIPPSILYHGTAKHFVPSILETGLNSKNRLHVHLSSNEKTARDVGKRHGDPVVLKIDAKGLYKNGHKFYLSNNGVWLASAFSSEYILEKNNLYKILNIKNNNLNFRR